MQRLLILVLSAYLGQASAGLAAEPASGTNPAILGAWVTYWDFGKSLQAVSAPPAFFRDVYFFVARLAPNGDPELYRSDLPLHKTVLRLNQRKIHTWLTLVNDTVDAKSRKAVLKDARLVNRILHNRRLRRDHERKIVQLARRYGFTGIDIDYENLAAEDRRSFAEFIGELARLARTRGLRLSVTVQPTLRKTVADGAGAMDLAAFGPSVDQVQVMLYNLHSCRSGPGPVASIAWIARVMRFVRGQCPSATIIPVLKVSGFLWQPQGCRAATYQDIFPRLAAGARVRRTADGTPYLHYIDHGRPTTVYYEDRPSLLHKIDALRRMGAKHVTLWGLGRHDLSLELGLERLLLPSQSR